MEDQPDCSFRTSILEALAGPLSDLFAVDLTAVSVTCAVCGKRQPLTAFDINAGGARGDCSLSQLPGSHAADWAGRVGRSTGLSGIVLPRVQATG